MQMMKSLRDISWQVSEEEYRADPALSYSTLARYEREGFNNLDKLFDRIETPSLTFGSAVDSIITGGQKEFDERFMVAEFPSTPDSITKIVKSLFSQYGDSYRSLITIPDDAIIKETECQSYQMNWKPETRAKVIKEKGADYYNLLFIAGSRTILDTQTYQDVCNAVRALKESRSTQFYFAEDNPFEPDIERLYQLKFKGEFGGITYRNMADLIIVNHKEKWAKPVDLKTSSHTEWDFYKSLVDWRYDIQARLYWAIIRQNMDKDEYFKDFKLLDYNFIVVNKRTLTPLVWYCPFTRAQGTLKFGKNDQIEMRSPFVIGKELNSYLTSRPKVPMGISDTGVNDLKEWLNTL
jgi:hypothetical protein